VKRNPDRAQSVHLALQFLQIVCRVQKTAKNLLIAYVIGYGKITASKTTHIDF